VKFSEFPGFPSFVRVVFLDMDHTLIATDCDVTWKDFLFSEGKAGLLDLFLKNWHYFRYRQGRLNFDAFMRFQLSQFKGRTIDEMQPLLKGHFEKKIQPSIYNGVKEWIATLRNSGLQVVICTATNEAIARPLFEFLETDDLLATRLEMREGRYTGNYLPPYVGGENKLLVIRDWLSRGEFTLDQSSYWGDSKSDILVLDKLGYPVAANPQSVLRKRALQEGWEIIDFE